MFSLNYRDARPIYEQVKDGLRHLVVTGAIQPGDQLPSVRALASALAINPNTIQRAYESLEAEGYLYTMPGKGSYASEQTGVNQDRRRRLLEQFDAAASELIFLGMTAEELALRDLDGQPLTRENYDALMARIDAYLSEFDEHGTDRVTVDLDEG